MMRGCLTIVFFANTWQLLLSLYYITANALLNCLVVEDEWQNYALKKKPLWVSSPIGLQR